MKKLLFILFVFTTITGYSKSELTDSIQVIKKLTAGDYLIKSAKMTKNASITMVLGAVVSSVGVAAVLIPLAVVGGVMILVGAIQVVIAWGDIDRAGRYLKRHNL